MKVITSSPISHSTSIK